MMSWQRHGRVMPWPFIGMSILIPAHLFRRLVSDGPVCWGRLQHHECLDARALWQIPRAVELRLFGMG
jgi:hypothetical protein